MRGAARALAVMVALTAAPAPAFADCDDPGRPLWGVPRLEGARVLAQLDRRTLRPLAGTRIALPRGLAWWTAAFSPDCARLAVAGGRGRPVVVIDLAAGRVTARLATPLRRGVFSVAWPTADRIMAIAGTRVVTLSLSGRRAVASHTEPGIWVAARRTRLGLVALVAPRGRVGAARLLLVRPEGTTLRVALERVLAGTALAHRRPGWARRQLMPALAVDEAGGRAYAVAAHRGLVGEVDLTSGAVAHHRIADAAPGARAAKGVMRGALREASWLGNGLIAVSGEDRRDRLRARPGELPTSIEPFGLRLVDTTSWTARTLNPWLRWHVQTGPVLLGSDVVPITPRRSHSTGLVAYALDGRRLLTRFAGDRRVGLWGAVWPYAHLSVRGSGRRLVVDLRTGRTVPLLRGGAWPFPVLD